MLTENTDFARPKAYRFQPAFELNLENAALLRDGRNLGLRPKTYETLLHLVLNRGRLVTKSELIHTIWADAAVTDDVLVQSVADIRRALGDDARNPFYVQTVPKRGYIFIQHVEPVSRELSEGAAPSAKGGAVAGEGGVLVRRVQPKPPPSQRMLFLGATVLALVVMTATAVFWPQGDSGAVLSNSLERTTIAIFPFETKSDQRGSEWLGPGIADMIGTGLFRLPGLQVVSQGQLRGVGGTDLDAGSFDTALHLARRLGADRIVTGQFYQLGGQLQVHASLVDAGSGVVEFTIRQRLTDIEGVFGVVDEICLRILRQIAAEMGLQANPGVDVRGYTSRSLDAYRHYIAGLDNFRVGGRSGIQQAQVELEQAIALDPTFSLAHFKLAQVQQWAGTWGYARVDPREAVLKAVEHSANLSDKERVLIEGVHALWIKDDPQAAVESWLDSSRTDPIFAAEAGVPGMLVKVLVTQGRFREACRYGEDFSESVYLSADDRARLHSTMARAYRNLGELDAAVGFAERSVGETPAPEGTVYWYHRIALGRYYLDGGRFDEALAIFDQARHAAQDAPIRTDLAWGFYMAGRKEEALQDAQTALRWDPFYGNAHHLVGWILLSRGQYQEAALQFEQAFERTPPQFGWTYHGIIQRDLPALYYAGVALQEAGQTEPAKQAFRRLVEHCRELRNSPDSRPPPDLLQTYSYQALGHCRLGEEQECLSLLEQIPEESTRLHEMSQHLARIYAVRGDDELALEWLERSIKAGAREFQHLKDNPDFRGLHNSARFRKLTEIPSDRREEH